MQQQRRRILSTPTSASQILTSQSLPAYTVMAAKTTPYEQKRRLDRRSPELIEAVHRLDHTQDPIYRAQLLEWIESAYADRMGGILVGLFSRCYLGEPYIDHRMTVAGGIVEHYTPSDSVPDAYREARTLARSPAYAYIEIYADGAIVPVRDDGAAG